MGQSQALQEEEALVVVPLQWMKFHHEVGRKPKRKQKEANPQLKP